MSQAPGLSSSDLADSSFTLSVLCFVAAGMVLLAINPGPLLGLGEGIPLPALTHLFTLGGVLGGYYPLSRRLWRRLYGREPVIRWFWPVILFFHAGGVAVMVWGLIAGNTMVVYIGGHYMVPTAILMAVLQGMLTGWRRRADCGRHLAAHMPGLGLVLVMSLGSMMVMDAYSNRYGIYTQGTILIHLLAGGFLFFLPLMLLVEKAGQAPLIPEAGEAGGMSFTAPLLPPIALASMGVLAIAMAWMEEGAAPGLPLGLLVLGGLALWLGMPLGSRGGESSLASVRRSLWAALGLLVLYAGIRAFRGMEPAEGLELTRFAVSLFLFALALPELLLHLYSRPGREAGEGEPAGQAPLFLALLLAAGLLLAAQLGQLSFLARAGALLWLGLLAWQAWRLLSGGEHTPRPQAL